ncbi:metalloregulator ArsR/SmtB family transcription factor [Dactylosporangium sp. NPDC005555]|uniref:ArsR/SmtB family transcription factor n=1 Tax=Dactylosporangium sp. NPDC005555 TaxID=3154889 RepID=UPI00339EFF87
MVDETPVRLDPGRAQIRDASTMRALAHPARIAILDRLFDGGEPATATELAEVCGLSPSATSYHLRELAKVNLIEQAPSRGDGRERVWRSQLQGLNIEAGPEGGAAERAADQELSLMFLEIEDARARAWLSRRDEEPYEWYTAATSADVQIQVTADELKALNDEVLALFQRYARSRRTDLPEGARQVNVTYRTFPRT